MRTIGSLLYIAFSQYIYDNLTEINGSIGSIRPDRAIKTKDYVYQMDKYLGKLPLGAKLNGEICMVTDIMDQSLLEVYFADLKRVTELKNIAFQIVDKLLRLVETHEGPNPVLNSLTELPLSERPHRTRKNPQK